MMTMSTATRDKDMHAKREGSDSGAATSNGKYTKASSTTISSRQWSGFKNPRIVRVSRAFGGKDRHSKVCTIRGLRDRRIRLSVPTAIQLYDLQDRLGLSQPSKVVDWLLDATKLDIDKLPPLQIPLGSFDQFHQAMLESNYATNSHHSSLAPFLDANLSLMKDDASKKQKSNDEDDDLQYQNGRRAGVDNDAQVSAQNFFPMNGGNTFLSGLLGSNSMPNYFQWDPSGAALSQFGSLATNMPSDHDRANDDNHDDNNGNNNGVQIMPSSSMVPSGSQLFLYPSSMFPPYANTQVHMENDIRHSNLQFHQLSSSVSPGSTILKSFPFNMNSGLPSNDESNGKDNGS